MKIRPKIENTALRPLFGPAVKHTSPLKMAVSGSFLASSLVDFGRKRLCKLLQALLKEVPSSFIDYSLFWMDTCISNLCKFLGPRKFGLGPGTLGCVPWAAWKAGLSLWLRPASHAALGAQPLVPGSWQGLRKCLECAQGWIPVVSQ